MCLNMRTASFCRRRLLVYCEIVGSALGIQCLVFVLNCHRLVSFLVAARVSLLMSIDLWTWKVQALQAN